MAFGNVSATTFANTTATTTVATLNQGDESEAAPAEEDGLSAHVPVRVPLPFDPEGGADLPVPLLRLQLPRHTGPRRAPQISGQSERVRANQGGSCRVKTRPVTEGQRFGWMTYDIQ